MIYFWITILIFYILVIYSIIRPFHFPLRRFFILFGLGVIATIILEGVIYSIGKELHINLYFFDIQIIGKNALANFEGAYRETINGLLQESKFFLVLGTVILPAILEECIKLFIFIFYLRIHGPLKTVQESVVGMVIIALGFAFMENMLYLQNFLTNNFSTGAVLSLMFLRIFLGSASHVFFSGIIGYGFGYSVFGKYQAIEAGHTRNTSFLKKVIGKFSFFDVRILSYIGTVSSLGISLMLGIGLHIMYNLFFFLDFSYVSFFFLIIGIIFFLWVLGRDTLFGVKFGEINEKILFLKMQAELSERKEKIFHTDIPKKSKKHGESS